jgi:hypothetical protein
MTERRKPVLFQLTDDARRRIDAYENQKHPKHPGFTRKEWRHSKFEDKEARRKENNLRAIVHERVCALEQQVGEVTKIPFQFDDRLVYMEKKLENFKPILDHEERITILEAKLALQQTLMEIMNENNIFYKD